MDARAVRNGNQQLAAHSLYKVQQIQPLLLSQHILKAFGDRAVRVLALKIIIGLVGPGAGDPDPGRSQILCQLDQPGIGSVDGVIPLLKISHIGPVTNHREFLCAVHLGLGISLPEGSSGNLCHLHIVRYQSLIHRPEGLQLPGIQFYEFCHNALLLFQFSLL